LNGRDTIRFLLGNQPREIRGVSPALTVLEYLRTIEGLTGTKEGCAEGDCGACTVVLAEPGTDGTEYKAVNACILFVPSLDGRQLLTAEHLRNTDGSLHPVQQAMVDRHASQCGFCTPGFTMSLFALQQTDPAPDRNTVNEALAGNLCRCTGYRPIADAAMNMAPAPAPAPPDLSRLDTTGMLALEHGGHAYFAPRSADELADILLRHPDATMVAGGTDVGLWVTKQHRSFPVAIGLDRAADMTAVACDGETIRIGAAATYEQAFDALSRRFGDLGLLIRRIGSRQVRNRGTIGGNIANASPIGDMPPALIALDASLVLRKGADRRTVKLETFFAGYRQTLLQPGEFIEWIDIPVSDAAFHCYKISKRFEQDISAVCGAFRLSLESGIVHDIRIGFGGMAATPVRAKQTEDALRGKPWSLETVRSAMAVLETEFQPLSDMRASAAYRRSVSRNLLMKLFLETAVDGAPRLRLDIPA
jgi:xanthine dehydrogenase small subunit